MQNGIHGNILGIIQAMYNHVNAAVTDDYVEKMSEVFFIVHVDKVVLLVQDCFLCLSTNELYVSKLNSMMFLFSLRRNVKYDCPIVCERFNTCCRHYKQKVLMNYIYILISGVWILILRGVKIIGLKMGGPL